ncbi:MAG: hypothetical protein OHK0052_01110 [Anaerolineales bacterium]
MKKRTTTFWLLVLAAAWVYDQLFWQKTPGISVTLYTALLIGLGFWFLRSEGGTPHRRALWILPIIALLALFSALRLEPLTWFVTLMLLSVFLMLLALTLRGGRWLEYSLTDLVLNGLSLAFSALGLGALDLAANPAPSEGTAETPPAARPKAPIVWAVVRGLLLAVPVLLVFGTLLASADPMFAQRLENWFNFFDIDKLGEYIGRGIWIFILAYLLTGVYLHSLFKSAQERLTGIEKPWLPPFLGFIETTVVLGSLNLLFALFVIVQFQYFFGGQSNIHIEGYTYAEYARRGFGELVLVAFLSLLLYFGLSTITRRVETQRHTFAILGTFMAALVGVMLVSAFQRLLLYEQTYGFTRWRTYPHVFMIWLGILLAALVVLEWLGRTRAFGLTLLACSLGFGLTLNFMNVDGWITRQNILLAQSGSPLDVDYLLILSADSTPTVIRAYQNPSLPQDLRDQLGAVLVCQQARFTETAQQQHWQSYNFSLAHAVRLLNDQTSNLSGYTLTGRSGAYSVEWQNKTQDCKGNWYLEEDF